MSYITSTIVEGREQLCLPCKHLEAVQILQHVPADLHENLEALLGCLCPFCCWLSKVFLSTVTQDALENLRTHGSRWQITLHGSGLENIVMEFDTLGEHLYKKTAAFPYGSTITIPIFAHPGLYQSVSINCAKQSPSTSTTFSNSLCKNHRLNVALNTDDPAAETVKGRDHHENPASDAAIEMVQAWISDCTNNHTNCRHAVAEEIPTCLVDVGLDQTTDTIRLVETHGSSQEEYIALSYVWGVRRQPVQLLRQTREVMLHGLQEDMLPQTLRDAIFLTRRLGKRFIWIDVLCIIQDDKLQKKEEILKMAAIFGNSYLIIQAANAATVFEGFLRPRDEPEMAPQKLRLWTLKEGYVYLRHEAISRQEGPAGTRAWCFEEGVLPRRVLVFGKEQIIWKCGTHSIWEDGRSSTDGSIDGPKFFAPSP